MQTVLVIDDNALQLRIREIVLREAGLDVIAASTPSTALDLLRNGAGSIAAIVTDHVMPEKSGAEFVRELRRIDPRVPVIVISGMPDAVDEYAGLNVAFRQKPCPPPELIRLVREAL